MGPGTVAHQPRHLTECRCYLKQRTSSLSQLSRSVESIGGSSVFPWRNPNHYILPRFQKVRGKRLFPLRITLKTICACGHRDMDCMKDMHPCTGIWPSISCKNKGRHRGVIAQVAGPKCRTPAGGVQPLFDRRTSLAKKAVGPL